MKNAFKEWQETVKDNDTTKENKKKIYTDFKEKAKKAVAKAKEQDKLYILYRQITHKDRKNCTILSNQEKNTEKILIRLNV